jgi:hypothetical protein
LAAAGAGGIEGLKLKDDMGRLLAMKSRCMSTGGSTSGGGCCVGRGRDGNVVLVGGGARTC